jgi:hypothetical protein
MLKIFRILLIFAFLLLSIGFYSISAESQTQVAFNESLIQNNIVILIDSSGSTLIMDQITHSSINAAIAVNAISFIRGLKPCTSAGVVAFGSEIRTTDMLSMSNDTNKKQLETFIREYGKPKEGKETTSLDKGLQAAEDLLNSVTGPKEILIISDGLIPDISKIKDTVVDLKNNNTNIQFIQVLDSSDPRMPFDKYELLAKAVDTKVAVGQN